MALADTARRLIAKHGRSDGALKRSSLAITVPPGKPWAPVATVPPVSPYAATGLSVVVLDALTVLKPEQLQPEQSAVAYLSGDFKPLKLDVLETKGERYSVLEVEDLTPGDETYLYILHLKAS